MFLFRTHLFQIFPVLISRIGRLPIFWSSIEDRMLGVVCSYTAWKVSKYRVFSDRYFPVFALNTERYSVSYSVRIRQNIDQKKIIVWTLLTEWYIHANYSKCSSFPKSTIISSNKSFAIFYSEFLRVCHSQLVLRCHKETYAKIGSTKQPIAASSTWLIYLLSKKWCRHYLMKVCFHEKNILNGYIKLT